MTNERKAPLCTFCGTRMRLAVTCYMCEGCGSTIGLSAEETAESTQSTHADRIRDEDSWLLDRHDTTDEEAKGWEDAGMPSHVDIIAGFLASNDFVYGVPDKAEIFRLHDLARGEEQSLSVQENWSQNTIHLHYVEPSPILAIDHTLAHRPMGLEDIVEVNYNVRLQAIVRKMHLSNIRVEYGNRDGDDPTLVFLGTEYPGPAIHRRIHIVRIEVKTAGFGIWKTVSKSTYPKSAF